MQYELIAEDLSGDTLFVEVSATQKINLDKLKENILLQSEILDLSASFSGPATGVVIESKIDKGKGPVSTVLISNGLLKKADYFVCGNTYGKIRAMINHEGKIVNEAPPSMPVEILGMNESVFAGAEFAVTENEEKAKEIAEFNKSNSSTIKKVVKDKTSIFENLNNKEELNIIIKSDVQGSSEALKNAINKIEHPEVKANIILSDIGMINESDVSLAKASSALLIGFNVKPNNQAKKLAEQQHVKIEYFNIIYEVLETIEKGLSGLLEPEVKETVIGTAEILKEFVDNNVNTVLFPVKTKDRINIGSYSIKPTRGMYSIKCYKTNEVVAKTYTKAAALAIAKNLNKNLIISQWNEDPVMKSLDYSKKNIKNIIRYSNITDHTFVTTHPSVLKKQNIDIKNFHYLFVPVDQNIECFDVSKKNPSKDLFYAMSHGVNRATLKRGKSDSRIYFLNSLIKKLNNINFDFYGFQNKEPIWGNDFYKALVNSKMGLNLSRGLPTKHYSSNRIASLMGNGLLTFVDKKTELDAFFNRAELVTYSDIADLSDKINYYKKNDKLRSKIASAGKKKYFKLFNELKVTKYILDISLGKDVKLF